MRRAEMAARGALSITFLALAAGLLAGQAGIRRAEAAAAGSLLTRGLGLDTAVNHFKPVFYVELPPPARGQSSWIGLTVTPECTVAWLLAPFLVLCAALVIGPRLRLRAALVATVVTAAALAAVNIVRLTIIGFATHRWGVDVGYRWSHDVYGSAVAIVGIALAVVVFLRLASRLSRPSTALH